MSAEELNLPAAFNVGAVFFFAITGALAARRLGYDFVGVFVLAFVTGTGGGILRDALLRGSGPVLALSDPRFVTAILAASFCGVFRMVTRIESFNRLVAVLDAIGLGAFAAVGTEKALQAQLHWLAALVVGVVNAVGGGLLRDVLTRTEPLFLKPGQFYALAALLGAAIFAGLSQGLHVNVLNAAVVATIATVVFRMAAIIFNWKTQAVESWTLSSEDPLHQKPLTTSSITAKTGKTKS